MESRQPEPWTGWSCWAFSIASIPSDASPAICKPSVFLKRRRDEATSVNARGTENSTDKLRSAYTVLTHLLLFKITQRCFGLAVLTVDPDEITMPANSFFMEQKCQGYLRIWIRDRDKPKSFC